MTDLIDRPTGSTGPSGPNGPTGSAAAAPARPAPIRRARRPREFTNFDVWILLGSIISSLCLNWLIFYRLTSGASLFGFLLCSYFAFLAIFAAVTTDRVGRLVALDRVMTVVVVTAAAVVFVPLVLLLAWEAFSRSGLIPAALLPARRRWTPRHAAGRWPCPCTL